MPPTATYRRRALLQLCLLAVALPAAAQDIDLQLSQPHWDVTAAPGAEVAWGPGVALLTTEFGAQCYALAKSSRPSPRTLRPALLSNSSTGRPACTSRPPSASVW